MKKGKKRGRRRAGKTSCATSLKKVERSRARWRSLAKRYAPKKEVKKAEAFVGPPEPERRAVGFNYEHLRDKRRRKTSKKRRKSGSPKRRGRKLSAWNKFVKKHRKGGKSLKAIARMYRKSHPKKRARRVKRDPRRRRRVRTQKRFDRRHRSWAGERESHKRRVRAAKRGARRRRQHSRWF